VKRPKQNPSPPQQNPNRAQQNARRTQQNPNQMQRNPNLNFSLFNGLGQFHLAFAADGRLRAR
jgi:hypothetical protein